MKGGESAEVLYCSKAENFRSRHEMVPFRPYVVEGNVGAFWRMQISRQLVDLGVWIVGRGVKSGRYAAILP